MRKGLSMSTLHYQRVIGRLLHAARAALILVIFFLLNGLFFNGIAPVGAASGTFTNASLITIPAGAPGTTSGNASPYPSTIVVSGLFGSITDVNVKFENIGHSHPDDLDIILVSPSGDSVILMSDACGSTNFEDFDWTFDDQAASTMPDNPAGACTSFFYKPSSYDGGSDVWPGAFPGPHGTTLSRFNGENANGVWSLYIRDDAGADVGDIEGGWSLTITTGSYVMAIPGTGTSGNGNPYPYTVNLESPLGLITDVNIVFNGLTHSHPDDLDIAVVSPDGNAEILMSDACGSFDIANYFWRWDDEAPAIMANSGTTNVCSAFNHRPTSYEPGDSWPSPGPGAVTTASLANFDGEAAIGQWQFFIVDDTGADVGFLINPPIIEASVAPPLIEIPNSPNTSGVADPYPLIRNIAGLPGLITDVNVSINEFWHLYPDDVDILLVSPSGTSTILMSDACGSTDIHDYFWTFDDEAGGIMTDSTVTGCNPFSIRPSDFGGNESLPAPAPPGPYHQRLSVFDGENPNGNWRIYIYDDAGGDTGFITPNITLNITTDATDVNLITNGNFAAGLAGWTPFAVPATGIVHNSGAGGVMHFYRVGGASQAAMQQFTGAALPANRAYDLALDLGNPSASPKKVRVVVHDASFQDLRACTFLLPPGTPLRRYKMVGETTVAWTNATVSVYASDADNTPWLQLDNVRLVARDDLNPTETLCLDPDRPSMSDVADGANIVANPSFASGLASWFTFGQINANVSGGVAQFSRLAGNPAGVLAQNIAFAPAANTTIEATFQLGNTSPNRRRVNVLLYQSGFADTPICTFWLPPSTPLQNYRMVVHTTIAWTGTAIAFYPADVLPTGFVLLDNVDVHHAQSEKAIGTGCYEPGSLNPAAVEEVGQDMIPTLEPTATPNLPPGELPIIATPQPFEPESSVPQEGSAGLEEGLDGEPGIPDAVEGQAFEGGG
jgi:subtilisin-like proprotein convertase family protein